jgi:hypothetical protein
MIAEVIERAIRDELKAQGKPIDFDIALLVRALRAEIDPYLEDDE